VCAGDHARFSFPALTIFPQQPIVPKQVCSIATLLSCLDWLELTGGAGP